MERQLASATEAKRTLENSNKKLFEDAEKRKRAFYQENEKKEHYKSEVNRLNEWFKVHKSLESALEARLTSRNETVWRLHFSEFNLVDFCR